MKIYSVYILNKAGGLIYQTDLSPGLAKLSANDYLVLAGTLHGVHAIASKLKSSGYINHEENPPSSNNSTLVSTGKVQNPNSNKTGLQSMETDLFNLYIFQTLTGIKFLIVTSPNPEVHNLQPLEGAITTRNELTKQFDATNEVFRKLYVLYSDYVMKDPFYSMDMPIKNSLFDRGVAELATI